MEPEAERIDGRGDLARGEQVAGDACATSPEASYTWRSMKPGKMSGSRASSSRRSTEAMRSPSIASAAPADPQQGQ